MAEANSRVTGVVGLRRVTPAIYPRVVPFDPPNEVYSAVTHLLQLVAAGPISRHVESLNPFSDWVKPGGTVLIKPNVVTNRDREKVLGGDALLSSSTHPAVVRPLVDLAWKALGEGGQVIIADSPIEGSDVSDTLDRTGYREMLQVLRSRGVNVSWLDLRDFTIERRFLLDDFRLGSRSLNVGWLSKRTVAGDPLGYSVIDLGSESLLETVGNIDRVCFHKSDPTSARLHHRHGTHLYSISNSVLQADLVINVAKLKTHKKTGITLALKSAMGMTNRKTWIPHYRRGWPVAGDEYDRKPRMVDRFINRLTRLPVGLGHSVVLNFPRMERPRTFQEGGSHPGNDTLWRGILDLNLAILYGNKDGSLSTDPKRFVLHLVDGVVGGEGDGPLRPVPRSAGILLCSWDPVALDAIGAEVMGFDSRKLPTIRGADLVSARRRLGTGRLDEITVLGDPLLPAAPPFKPAPGWEYLLH